MLVDHRVPRVDAFEIARWLRADRRVGGVPVVCIGAEADRDRAQAAGSRALVARPLDLDVLADAGAAAVGAAPGAAAPQPWPAREGAATIRDSAGRNTHDRPGGCLEQLPHLVDGPLAGHPRVYARAVGG